MDSLPQIANAINRASNVIICGHVMPDGDCIGSMIATGMALESMGKAVTLISHDPIPEIYRFLPKVEDIHTREWEFDKCYDTFIILDCSVPQRLGDNFKRILEKDLVVINLDHHTNAVAFADYNYIDPLAAATGEIVFDLLELFKVPITEDIATCLYVAIITDTGSFQHENTLPGTHRRVASLIEHGIPLARVNNLLFKEKPLLNLRVLEVSLQTLRLSQCGRVAWMSVTRDMLNRLQALDEHTDELIDYVRVIKGVEIAIIFKEISIGRFKIGFRSKESVNVNYLAGLFGGGGHNRAAGCVLEGEMAEIQRKVIASAIDLVKEEKPG